MYVCVCVPVCVCLSLRLIAAELIFENPDGSIKSMILNLNHFNVLFLIRYCACVTRWACGGGQCYYLSYLVISAATVVTTVFSCREMKAQVIIIALQLPYIAEGLHTGL